MLNAPGGAERLVAAMAAYRELASEPLESGALMQGIVERARAVLDADAALLGMHDGADVHYTTAVGVTLPEAGVRVPMGSSRSGNVYRRGATTHSPDAGLAPVQDRPDVCDTLGFRSEVLLPLVHEGRSIAVLAVLAAKPNHFRPEDIETVELMAPLFAAVLRSALELEARRVLIAERDAALEQLSASEARFRALIDHSWDPITIVDAAGKVCYASPAYIRTFGIRPEDRVGGNAFDRIHPDDVARTREFFAGMLARAPSASDSISVRVRHGQGGWAWVVATATNLLHDPAVRGIVINSRDVTGEHRAIDELLAAEHRHAELLEALPLIVYSVSPEPPFAPTYVSPGVQALGFSREEWLARPDRWVSLLHPDDRERVLGATAAALQSGSPLEYEYRVYARDGQVRWIHDRGHFVRDAGGQPVAWQGVMVDVTARHDAEQARADAEATARAMEAQSQQSQRLEAIGRLAGGVAHDFNNLLTVITTVGQLLRGELDPSDERREDVDLILEAASRAASLTSQLLAFGRRQILRPRPVDLNDVVRDTTPLLERLVGPDIRVRTELDPALDSVLADPAQLQQVLLNLGANSRDAMPSGGTITIRTTNDAGLLRAQTPVGEPEPAMPERAPAGYVLLEVEDDGEGMDRATTDRVFEPFFSAHPGAQSAGLGLAMIYGVVRQSGGEVTVESTAGHGTTFRIFLPRVARAVADERVAEDSAAPSRPGTVLLVDDNASVRAVARRVLERAGCAVHEADSGAAALELLRRHEVIIDVLVTDLVMPGMGGRDLADRVLAAQPHARVLFMSGYEERAAENAGVLAGGTLFLQKPFSVQALSEKVRILLNTRRELP